MMKKLAVAAAVLIMLAAGIYIGYNHYPAVAKAVSLSPYSVSYDGLIAVNVSIEPPNVMLDNGCKRVDFDVTADQSMSIYNGIHGTSSVRPLTQDIMKDVMENFGIEMLQVKIDRYEDEIYYATITMRKDNDILVLDARPSDSIALALRQKIPVYFNKSLFEEKSTEVC